MNEVAKMDRWHVDAVHGDDERGGRSNDDALRTLDEVLRRVTLTGKIVLVAGADELEVPPSVDLLICAVDGVARGSQVAFETLMTARGFTVSRCTVEIDHAPRPRPALAVKYIWSLDTRPNRHDRRKRAALARGRRRAGRVA